MLKEVRTDKTKPMTRELAFSLDSADKDKRTIEISFSSEAPYTRYDWWSGEPWIEILDHSEGAMDLERLNAVGVVAYNHDLRSRLPIGSVEKAWLDPETKKCRAVLRFDNDPDADQIWQKILSGTLRGVSFMYEVHNWEVVKPGKKSTCGRFEGPCEIARSWTPYEVGPVAIPADYTVGAGRSSDADMGAIAHDIDPNKNTRSDIPMTEAELRAAIAAEVDPIKKTELERKLDAIVKEREAKEAQAREAAIATERARTAEITSICREFGVDDAEYIKSGAAVDTVKSDILKKLAEERTAVNTRVTVGKEESDKRRAAAIDGVLLRGGIAIDKPAPGAEDFRNASLLDLCRYFLEQDGVKTWGMSPMDLARDAVISVSDFPEILSNVANKSMSQGYGAAPTTYQYWTRKGSLPDFKAQTRLRLSEFPDLEKVIGEYKHADPLTEGKETISLDTYGALFSLSRKAIINDDLNALTVIPARMGAAARRKVNTLVYTTLLANGALTDGVAVFHADHGNLASSGAALSVASLGKAKAAMRVQKNIGSKEILNITPSFLLVPAELETIAKQLIASIVDPTKNNATPNPFSNELSIVVEPLLADSGITNYSATAWYLAAAPGLVDTVEVAFLNGNDSPYMESRQGFEVDGIEYKIRLDFGVKVLDHRGLYKNPGA